MKILVRIKKLLDINYSAKSKYYDDLKKLVIGQIKDGTGGVAIVEFIGLGPKVYSVLVDDSAQYKKGKGVNKDVNGTMSHSEYKDVLLKRKCLSHSMSGIQSKNNRIDPNKSANFFIILL